MVARTFEELGDGLMFNNSNWTPWTDKIEMSYLIKNVIYKAWPGLDDFLDTLITPPLKLDEDPPDVYEILEQMKAPLEAIMTMVLSGEFGYFQMYNEAIKTEYYEEILIGDLDRLCYIFCLGVSKFMLSKLLYHIDRKFLPQFLKNMLIKPNLQPIIDKCKKSFFVKSTMAKEQDDTERMNNLIYEICQHYMITQNYDAMESAIDEFANIHIPDKAQRVGYVIDGFSFFVPQFFIDALKSEDPKGVLMYDERLKRFTYEMLRAHDPKTLEELCLKYGTHRNRRMDISRIANLHIERKSHHGVMYCPEVDGLSIQELKVLDRLRKNQLTDSDMEIVNKSQKMLNIKAVMDKEVQVGDVVDIDNLTMTITKKDGTKRVYNYGDKTFKYRYNDALRMLFDEETALAIRAIVEDPKSKLYGTGITEKEQMDRIGQARPFDPRGMTHKDLNEHREKVISTIMTTSPMRTKMRVFAATKLGTPEHPKLEYLTINDLLNSIPFIVERDADLLAFKLIELKQLRDFIQQQDKYIEEGIKMDKERIEKMKIKTGNDAYDDGYKRIDFGDTSYIAHPDPDPFNIDRNVVIQKQDEVIKTLQAELEAIKRKRSSWINNIPKITNARL